IHITPAWEVAADIKITLEIAELIENDDFSKRTKLEQTKEHSYPKAKPENFLKQDTIQEISELEFPTRNPNKKTRSISTESLELDEIQKIRNTKLPDDPKRSYFQETEGYLIEGIQVEKEILNLNPNLERKIQPGRLRNDKQLRNETIGSLQNEFEIHDAPSDPILIQGSVVDLRTLDLTSLYSVP
ncbi:hypothetical protein QMM85_17445, partial [Leptospira santarosai]|nr:hypothetical protein [Leptospira santarosai]